MACKRSGVRSPLAPPNQSRCVLILLDFLQYDLLVPLIVPIWRRPIEGCGEAGAATGEAMLASIGASILKQLGFRDVSNVPGSWQAWKKARFPIEGGEKAA